MMQADILKNGTYHTFKIENTRNDLSNHYEAGRWEKIIMDLLISCLKSRKRITCCSRVLHYMWFVFLRDLLFDYLLPFVLNRIFHLPIFPTYPLSNNKQPYVPSFHWVIQPYFERFIYTSSKLYSLTDFSSKKEKNIFSNWLTNYTCMCIWLLDYGWKNTFVKIFLEWLCENY